jgi:hypothetical protein
MAYQHQELAAGKWNKLTLMEQLANVGSEVIRTINWRKKGNLPYSNRAFDRAIELLDLTISDHKNIKRLRELTRVREVLADYFIFDNYYQSNAEQWERYFLAFNYAARLSN